MVTVLQCRGNSRFYKLTHENIIIRNRGGTILCVGSSCGLRFAIADILSVAGRCLRQILYRLTKDAETCHNVCHYL